MEPTKVAADKHVGRRSPELIKKGLQCRVLGCSEKCDHRCNMCDFYVPNYNLEDRYADALSYIQDLESDLIKERELNERLKSRTEALESHTSQLNNPLATFSELRKWYEE